MRVAFLGTSGLLSLHTAASIVSHHRLVFVARPRAGTGKASGWRRAAARLGWRRAGPLDRLARAAGLAVTVTDGPRDAALAGGLREARPDVLCVAGYPWLLPPDILAIPALGGLNVHGALLPRHRGFLPLFWIYHANDRTTGVSVHWMTDRADAGDLVDQATFDLPRGEPVARLNQRNAEAAGPLVAAALEAVAAGTATRTSQDHGRATTAPYVRAGTPMAAFDEWDVERVWHFLAGLWPYFIEPLTAPDGRPVRYGGVSGYTRTLGGRAPGTVEATRDGFNLHCLGGRVHLQVGR